MSDEFYGRVIVTAAILLAVTIYRIYREVRYERKIDEYLDNVLSTIKKRKNSHGPDANDKDIPN